MLLRFVFASRFSTRLWFDVLSSLKLLRRERDSAASHKSSFDALIQELEDYSRIIRSESSALIPEGRKQIISDGRELKGARPSW